MPSLPRIRRTRARDTVVAVTAPPAPPAELNAAGLTWIHLDAPDAMYAGMLAERFGWHPLDVEDVLSKRQRPKIDDYADEGYLFGVLHFPVYDRTIQRLNAAELDFFIGPDYLVTLPTVELRPVTRLFRRCVEDEDFPRAAVHQGVGTSALRGARRSLRLLLPDPRQDRAQARLARGRRIRGAFRRGRARHLEREAGDHQLPEDRQAGALHAASARAARRAVPAGGARSLFRRHRRRSRAHLGHPRQLQGSRRSARGRRTSQ